MKKYVWCNDFVLFQICIASNFETVFKFLIIIVLAILIVTVFVKIFRFLNDKTHCDFVDIRLGSWRSQGSWRSA